MEDRSPWGPAEAGGERLDAGRLTYAGDWKQLFRIVFRGTLLTALTLGIHRFWLRTRQRRYYWSAIRLDGEPLEFTGRPLELLVGFMIAIVALALILAALNLALVFVGIAVFQDNVAASAISAAATLPLIQFARYRARRYLLARTRWRGIRMSMGAGAWGYALRWVGLWLLAALSFGLLYPVAQVRLRRYLTERTWFGSLRFSMGGSFWRMLALWLPVWLLLAGGAAWALMPVLGVQDALLDWLPRAADGISAPPSVQEAMGASVLRFLGGALLAVLLIAWYGAASHRLMAGWTRLGEGAALASDLRARTLIWVRLRGYFLLTLAVSLVSGLLGLVVATIGNGALNPIGEGGLEPGAGLYALFAAMAVVYVAFFSFVIAAAEALIAQPLLRAYVVSTSIDGIGTLSAARQRAAEGTHGGEGLADAFDVGAAF